MADQKFAPSVTAARLFEKIGKSGNHYLVGRLGMLKIAILKTSEPAPYQPRHANADAKRGFAKPAMPSKADPEQSDAGDLDQSIPF